MRGLEEQEREGSLVSGDPIPKQSVSLGARIRVYDSRAYNPLHCTILEADLRGNDRNVNFGTIIIKMLAEFIFTIIEEI